MVIDATGNRRTRLPPELLMIPRDASVFACMYKSAKRTWWAQSILLLWSTLSGPGLRWWRIATCHSGVTGAREPCLTRRCREARFNGYAGCTAPSSLA